MVSDFNDFNSKVIDEFRANDGKVGGSFEGATLVLLHHKGARTGGEYVTPLMTRPDNGNYVVFASKGGAPTHPDWFHNLVANPDATIEVGTDKLDVRARVAEGEERERIWSAQKQEVPQFAEYEEKAAGRQIPVVILEPQ